MVQAELSRFQQSNSGDQASSSASSDLAVRARLELQRDLDNSRDEMAARCTALQAEFEQARASSGCAEAKCQRMCSELEQHQVMQIKDLRRDLTTLQERTQLMAQSNEEVQKVHKVILQSAGDLTSGIDQVSQTAADTERRLQQEIQATRAALEARIEVVALEATDTQLKAELSEVLEMNNRDLQRSIADEREKR